MPRQQKKDNQDKAPRDLGRYRLHGEIAAGGMATVHFGRQVGTGGFAKTVAIKRLHPQFGKIPEFVTMFLAEARLAARIRHPNVVQPLDLLTLDDEVFLVMEYVDGDSLSRLMKATVARKERVDVRIGVTIMCGVLHGLHAAHEAKSDRGEPLGIVHRDVSPQNILVGVDGVPRVIDFGIAKAADSVQITRDGELKGKLSYMSPEQLNGGAVTRRIDIYAASVVLWEILTGQRLFDADYQSAILKNILHRPIDPPSEIVHDLPLGLDAIVLKGLHKDPHERWETTREMALALEERIVLANPSQIGAWVEKVAALSLHNRAARIAEIEAVTSGPVEGVAEEVISEMVLLDAKEVKTEPPLGWRRRGDEPAPPPSRRAIERAVLSGTPPALGSNPSISDGRISAPPSVPSVPFVTPAPSVRSAPAAAPPSSARTLASAPSVSTPASIEQTGPRPPPPTIQVPEGPAIAPQWPVPGILPAPVQTVVEPAAHKRSSGGGVLVILLVLAAALACFYFYLPDLIRRGYVASAAREGMTLSIDQVEVSPRTIRLVGVSLAAAEVPGVTVRAQSIDLALQRIEPVRMTAHGVFVSVDGSYVAVHDAVASFVTAHAAREESSGGLRHVVVESSHVVWNRPFGEATRLELQNVTATAERQLPHAIGEDLDLDAPLVQLTVASGKVGPWHAKWHRDGPTSRVNLALDALGTSGAQANIVIFDGALQSVDAGVPRLPLAQIGIPPEVLGRKADEPLAGEANLRYVVHSPTQVEGQVHLAVSAARIAGAAAAADAGLDTHFEGDPAQPLPLQDGVLGFGPYRGRLAGTVTVTGTYVKVDASWKSAAMRCPGGDQVVNGVLKLDSRNVDDLTLALVPNIKCRQPLFPP